MAVMWVWRRKCTLLALMQCTVFEQGGKVKINNTCTSTRKTFWDRRKVLKLYWVERWRIIFRHVQTCGIFGIENCYPRCILHLLDVKCLELSKKSGLNFWSWSFLVIKLIFRLVLAKNNKFFREFNSPQSSFESQSVNEYKESRTKI